MHTKIVISYILKDEKDTIMQNKIGSYQLQQSGYKAFIQHPFPPNMPINLSQGSNCG